jgi:hypothetical protein
MDAVTYPDSKVAAFIGENLIPLRLAFNDAKFAPKFNVQWTPTLITLDGDGAEHYRTVGFLGPDEFIASQLLGIGKADFDLERFDEALAALSKLIESHPKSKCVPEAIFLRGVALYKSSHDPKPLKAAYEKLQSDFPTSEWTERAYPYRLIQ